MLQQLGFGVGLRPAHYPDFHAKNTPKIDWLEIISENFMFTRGRPLEIAKTLRQDYPMAMHGVSLSIGSHRKGRDLYLAKLKTLADILEPFLISDHLCFTGYQDQNTHDLLPTPMTRDSFAAIAENINMVQDTLKRPLVLENISKYVDFCENEFAEPEFLNALCKQTGCRILLDINNLVVNERNFASVASESASHSQALTASAFIHAIRPEFVTQYHLAGHTDCGSYLYDTHCGPIPDGVLQLYDEALRVIGPRPTLIEWDDEIPSLQKLIAEAERVSARLHSRLQHHQIHLQTPQYENPRYP